MNCEIGKGCPPHHDSGSKLPVSTDHDEALVRELRADPAYAAEYLQAAMEDTEEPAVLLIALRHVVEAFTAEP